MSPIEIVPYKQERERANTKMVTLWFVGYKMLSVAEQAGTRIGPLYVRHQAYTLPALGEKMVVDAILAKDIVEKSRWEGEDTLIYAAQGGEQLAQYLKDSMAKGVPLSELNLPRHRAKSDMQHLSDEDLLAELESRGKSLDKGPKATNLAKEVSSEEKSNPPKVEEEQPVVVKKNSRKNS